MMENLSGIELNSLMVGERFCAGDDTNHIGVAEIVRDERVYLRWHKGYATWERIGDLRYPPENAVLAKVTS